MKKRDIHKMLAWLSQVLTCPICDSHYPQGSTKLLEKRQNGKTEDGSVIVHSDCPNCQSSVMFSVASFGTEIFSVGMISDLNAADALRFRQASSLTADDVLLWHMFLKDFDGDFKKVFVK